MEQRRTIWKHGIHIHLLNVRLVGDRVHWHKQIPMMLYGTVVGIYLIKLYFDLIKRISRLPLVLSEHAHDKSEHKSR